jgi:hypothetical protein
VPDPFFLEVIPMTMREPSWDTDGRAAVASPPDDRDADVGAEQARMVEDALCAALCALEEQASLSRRLAARFRHCGEDSLAARHERRADDYIEQARVLRESLLGEGPPVPR